MAFFVGDVDRCATMCHLRHEGKTTSVYSISTGLAPVGITTGQLPARSKNRSLPFLPTRFASRKEWQTAQVKRSFSSRSFVAPLGQAQWKREAELNPLSYRYYSSRVPYDSVAASSGSLALNSFRPKLGW